MRILYVSTFSYPTLIGGADRTLHNLVEGMRTRGHEVRVVSLQSANVAPIGSRPDYLSTFPVRNLYCPDGTQPHGAFDKLRWHIRDIYNPRAAEDVETILKEFQPDILSSHNLAGWSVAVWDMAARHNVPVVQVLHDFYLTCVAGSRSVGGSPCQKTCTRCRLLRLPHRTKSKIPVALVGISNYMLQHMDAAGYFPSARKARIYNVERPLCLAPEALLDPATPVFGFIGRIAPHKGIETLLEAFSAADLPTQTRLLIAGVGEPGYVSELADSYTSDNVHFVGHTNPKDFFPQLSWTVMPSLSDEPLGRVVFESHGFGVPVLGSRRGGIPEMIEDGVTGHLFEAGNVKALTELLERSAHSGRPTSRAEIAAKSASFFDTNRFIDEYETVYYGVLREPTVRKQTEGAE